MSEPEQQVTVDSHCSTAQLTMHLASDAEADDRVVMSKSSVGLTPLELDSARDASTVNVTDSGTQPGDAAKVSMGSESPKVEPSHSTLVPLGSSECSSILPITLASNDDYGTVAAPWDGSYISLLRSDDDIQMPAQLPPFMPTWVPLPGVFFTGGNTNSADDDISLACPAAALATEQCQSPNDAFLPLLLQLVSTLAWTSDAKLWKIHPPSQQLTGLMSPRAVMTQQLQPLLMMS